MGYAVTELLPNGLLTTPRMNDLSRDHRYLFAASELTANRIVTFPALTTDANFVFDAFANVFTAAQTIQTTGVSGGNTALTVTSGNHTALTVKKPAVSVSAATITLADTTTIAQYGWQEINAPTFQGVVGGGAEVITNASALYITGAPTQGANITLTNSWALHIASGPSRIAGAPTATANYGLLNIGNGAFDGASAGFFTGSANGTDLAINAASGFSGNLIDVQVAGVKRLVLTSVARVGIGTTTPVAALDVDGGLSDDPNIQVTGYLGSAGARPGTFHSRAARGTFGAPTAVQSGDYLGGYGVRSYTGTQFTEHSTGAITFYATENFSDTNQGTRVIIGAVKNGNTWASVTNSVGLMVDQSGFVGINMATITTAPSAQLHVIAGTIAADGTTNAMTMTATMPTVPTANQTAISWTITGAGNAAFAQNAFVLSLAAGYTGASSTMGASIANSSAGTDTAVVAGSSSASWRTGGNRAIRGQAIATTAGYNSGVGGLAGGGANNMGVLGSSTTQTAAAVNIGVFGTAQNVAGGGALQVGGYFTLRDTASLPTFTSAALIADNDNQASPIFLGRANGTTVFTIASGGAVTAATAATAAGAVTMTISPGAHTAVVAETMDLSLSSHTITITGGYATQRFVNIAQPTITAAAPQTITTVATMQIDGAPQTAGSAVITGARILRLGSNGNLTLANAAGSSYYGLVLGAHTLTLATTTQVNSTPGYAGVYLASVTINQSGGAVTMDAAATMYIAGPATAGTSVTITNNYAMWIDAGSSRFDGDVLCGAKLYPSTDAAALQTAASINAGTGAPNNANGADGDFYFRSDGGALTSIYQRRAGAWVGIV